MPHFRSLLKLLTISKIKQHEVQLVTRNDCLKHSLRSQHHYMHYYSHSSTDYRCGSRICVKVRSNQIKIVTDWLQTGKM